MFETRYTYVHESRKYKGKEGYLLAPVTRSGADRIREPGLTYEVKSNGIVVAKRKDIADILPPLRRTLKTAKYGADVRLRAYSEAEMVDAVRFYKTRVAVDDPYDPYQYGSGPATEGIKRWAGYLKDEYEGNGTFRFAGMTVCKPDSDHAHGAALDNFDTWERMHQQRREFFALADEGGWEPKYFILADSIYFPDGHGGSVERDHTGAYHGHGHASVKGGVEVPGCPYDHDTSWS